MWPSPQAASAWQRPGLTRKCGLPDIHWCQAPPCTGSHWPARRAWGPSPPPPQNGRPGRLHSHPTVYASPRWLWPAAHRVTARQKAGGACSTRGSRLPTGRVGAGTWGPVGAVLKRRRVGWQTWEDHGCHHPGGTEQDRCVYRCFHVFLHTLGEGLAVSVPFAHSPSRGTEKQSAEQDSERPATAAGCHEPLWS